MDPLDSLQVVLVEPQHGELASRLEMVFPHAFARARLNPDAAWLLGAAAGGVLGYGLTQVVCKTRHCEMGDLIGLAAGATIGGAIGFVLAGGLR